MKKKIALLILLAMGSAQSAHSSSVTDFFRRAQREVDETVEMAKKKWQFSALFCVFVAAAKVPTGLTNLGYLCWRDHLYGENEQILRYGWFVGTFAHWAETLKDGKLPIRVTDEGKVIVDPLLVGMAVWDLYVLNKMIHPKKGF